MNPARRRPGKERATRSLRPSASLSLFPDVLFTRKRFISWKTRPAGGLNSQLRKGCGSGPRRTSPGGSAERPGPPESSLSSLLHPPPSATGFSSRLNIFFSLPRVSLLLTKLCQPPFPCGMSRYGGRRGCNDPPRSPFAPSRYFPDGELRSPAAGCPLPPRPEENLTRLPRPRLSTLTVRCLYHFTTLTPLLPLNWFCVCLPSPLGILPGQAFAIFVFLECYTPSCPAVRHLSNN